MGTIDLNWQSPIEAGKIRSLQSCSGGVNSPRKPLWESQLAQLRWQLVALLLEPLMEHSSRIALESLSRNPAKP